VNAMGTAVEMLMGEGRWRKPCHLPGGAWSAHGPAVTRASACLRATIADARRRRKSVGSQNERANMQEEGG
jgi:hypothetical protein